MAFVIADSPLGAAERVAAIYGKSTATYLDFAEAFVACWQRFAGKEQQIEFLNRLAELGVISVRDAMVLTRSNGMISMIKKIGDNADWLRRAEILPLLVPEPSKLYQIVLLREVLNDDIDLTVSKLRTLEPGYTRDDIISLKPSVKSSGSGEQYDQNGSTGDTGDLGTSDNNNGSDASSMTSRKPVSASALRDSPTPSEEMSSQTFDLVAVRCLSRDLRRLRTDYADANELDRLLPRPPLASLSAAVVFAKVADISVIETRLLPHLGFSRTEHVFAVGDPSGPDLAHQQIALVSIRGLSCTLPRDALSSEYSPLQLATRLFPKTKSKAQMFCEPDSDWTSFGWVTEEA